jgi:hypothetical protein
MAIAQAGDCTRTDGGGEDTLEAEGIEIAGSLGLRAASSGPLPAAKRNASGHQGSFLFGIVSLAVLPRF